MSALVAPQRIRIVWCEKHKCHVDLEDDLVVEEQQQRVVAAVLVVPPHPEAVTEAAPANEAAAVSSAARVLLQVTPWDRVHELVILVGVEGAAATFGNMKCCLCDGQHSLDLTKCLGDEKKRKMTDEEARDLYVSQFDWFFRRTFYCSGESHMEFMCPECYRTKDECDIVPMLARATVEQAGQIRVFHNSRSLVYDNAALWDFVRFFFLTHKC